MESPLDRLAELVRSAEARIRAEKLGGEARNAANGLRSTEERARAVQLRLKAERPALRRALAEAIEDDQKLKDLVRKAAQLMGTAAITPEQGRQIERDIDDSRVEIEQRRASTQVALDALEAEAAEARESLSSAIEQYQELRREIDRLQPELAADFATADRLAAAADLLFPAGQVRALDREVSDASLHFGMLDPKEQLAQLTIWIGRYRRLQAFEAQNLPEPDQGLLQRIFPKLVGISKHYEPGYIEAFRQGYTTDWDAYVAEAEEQFRRVAEQARLRRQEAARHPEPREPARPRHGREPFERLKAIVQAHKLPEEGTAEFRDALFDVVSQGGASDPEVLELVGPYRELLSNSEYQALLAQLDRPGPEVPSPSEG